MSVRPGDPYPHAAPDWLVDVDEEFTGAECWRCHRAAAMICWECVRAAAIGYWASISRHPVDDGVRCVFCGGAAEVCAMCFPDAAVSYRESLNRTLSHPEGLAESGIDA